MYLSLLQQNNHGKRYLSSISTDGMRKGRMKVTHDSYPQNSFVPFASWRTTNKKTQNYAKKLHKSAFYVCENLLVSCGLQIKCKRETQCILKRMVLSQRR